MPGVDPGRRAGRGHPAGPPAPEEGPARSATVLGRGLRVLPLVVALVVTAAPGARGQIDSEPRTTLELGVEGPLRGDGGVGGYAFLLWNRPRFLDPDLYLRVVFAPTYLTGELVRDRWPGEGHAVGVGFGVGLFPYDFDEFRLGDRKDRESFWGHGGDLPLSYYRRLLVADVLPLEAQLRLRPQYVAYMSNGDTAPAFRLPPDTPVYSARAGVRLGGEPPELFPEVAVELSLWYEASYRQNAGTYGLPERPFTAEHDVQQAWGRLGGIYPVTKNQTARLFLTAGTSWNADPLTSYRLGSALPFRREFPLILHGYYVDEVFARRFWLVNASYRFPVFPRTERVHLQLSFDYAQVDYLAGHRLPRGGLRGLGADLTIAVTPRITWVLGYGYGVDAPRTGGFGGHELNTLIELKY